MAHTTEEATHEGERKVIADVAQYGWHVINVLAEPKRPGFAYTIGLEDSYQHPELIMIGQRLEVCHAALNELGAAIKGGRRFAHWERSGDVFEGYTCVFVDVEPRHYRQYMGFAIWWHRGAKFRTLQVVWPDLTHRLPWDKGSDAKGPMQPMLGPVPRLSWW